MFGLGIWEIALIAVVALLVLGPEKLPDAARSLGKALRDFRRAGDDLKREMIGEMDAEPHRPRPPALTQPVGSVTADQPAGPAKESDAKEPGAADAKEPEKGQENPAKNG